MSEAKNAWERAKTIALELGLKVTQNGDIFEFEGANGQKTEIREHLLTTWKYTAATEGSTFWSKLKKLNPLTDRSMYPQYPGCDYNGYPV